MTDQDKNQHVAADDTGANDQGQNQGQNQHDGHAADKGEKSVPYTRFQQVNEQKKAAEGTLQELVDELKQDIPEDMQDLVPNGLNPADQVRWIRNAMKKGLFSQGQAQDGPDPKRAGGKPPTDFEGMSPQSIMAQGYK
jgi:hypothetical protein